MKKINQLILRSYIGPFVLTFLVVLFILLMQFVWKYIDDFVGKGLEWHLLAELMFYVSVTLMPMALPLAILMASIITFGNLAEHYELTALKSAGVSLQRIFRPLIYTTLLMCIGAFFFSNNVLPVANLKMGALLYDITHQKPSLDIREGIFYNGIQDVTIKVARKDKQTGRLFDIMIYDHSQRNGCNKVVTAREAVMKMSADEKYLVVTLFNGNSYEDMVNRESKGFHPMTRSVFKQQTLMLDMSDFKMTRTDETLFKDNYQMLNISQLASQIDTLHIESFDRKKALKDQIKRNRNFELTFIRDTTRWADTCKKHILTDVLMNFDAQERRSIFEQALSLLRSEKVYFEVLQSDTKNTFETINRYKIEWHKKFTLSFACLVLFFIGAPMGAIIRKGGIGMPSVVSVIFFLFFHVLTISGEKSAKEGVWDAWQGAWLASLVLLPVGIFLTYKATRDSAIFDLDAYLAPIRKWTARNKNEGSTNLQ